MIKSYTTSTPVYLQLPTAVRPEPLNQIPLPDDSVSE